MGAVAVKAKPRERAREAPAELTPQDLLNIWAEIEAAGHRCRLCGGPVESEDARRRIDPPTPEQDEPGNWTAMCQLCQDALDQRHHPPPARYVHPGWRAGARRARLAETLWVGLVLLSFAAFGALAWLVVALILWAEGAPFRTVAAIAGTVMLLSVAWNVWHGFARGRRTTAAGTSRPRVEVIVRNEA